MHCGSRYCGPHSAAAARKRLASLRSSPLSTRAHSSTKQRDFWETHDLSRLGGWDTTDGPACLFVGRVEEAPVALCEELYSQARDTYFAGVPSVDDAMFDRLEHRLLLAGSELVRKYPRCSLRSRSLYSDARADLSQMYALVCFWIALLCCGGTLVAAAAVGEQGVPASAGLLGGALGTVGLRALATLSSNSLVALRGECPSCGEEVYAFVQAAARGSHAADCHVCARPLRFDVRLAGAQAPPWQRRAAGRIVLVSRTRDFFPAGGA